LTRFRKGLGWRSATPSVRPEIFFDAVVLTKTARPMSTLATEALDMIRGAARAIS
jgi:hypothetical protein